ncbi:autophagy related lipase-like protein Atg15 [Macroventuria anomochaeta]|uniref:Autophagy related lipase-like protein Atg15 n=1 Tax=Macroventuria anomochaeta TaxID=301207 RepID=A0ACB6SE05_9PLEO|nr:autophagy related lipase-like protein Atg15 [Macroventuria anomochaeta]KAF2631568.1 autophagy related lipase-like protein Atg15 [Macroventuria anomochaeta]
MNSPEKSRQTWAAISKSLFAVGIFAQVAILLAILGSYLGVYPSTNSPLPDREVARVSSNDGLTLRHVIHHGAGRPGARARRLDVTADRVVQAEAAGHFGPFVVKKAPIVIEKPSRIHKYDGQRPMWSTMSPIWVAEDVAAPDVEDKDTIISLASMSEDAYKPGPDDSEWMDVDGSYNSSVPFGWDDSGIRGHVFSDDMNTTVILSVKGTTVAMFEGNGTSGHDKENDNLFGSCCCGQGGSYWWKQSCDCMTGTYSCDDKCVREELRKPNRYYQATLELYEEVLRIYPDANIITTGHSLGGVLASLIGLQHGIPAISFEAYPQAMAAKRLGLPAAGDVAPLRKNTGGFHFGHTADPVYMGTCNGFSSFCSIGGYAFETLCHTGKRCAYDVVKDWGWRPSTSTHRLRYAIENVYKKYEEAATCVDEDVTCVDCFLWKFEDGTHTTPATTSTAAPTSRTRTRTETCKTPGWWGCRDETSTTATATSTATLTEPVITFTSESSTSTCKTPGWFGCKDKTTALTTSPSSKATTTTCTSKGWFGRCADGAPVTTTPAAEAYTYYRTAPTATRMTP